VDEGVSAFLGSPRGAISSGANAVHRRSTKKVKALASIPPDPNLEARNAGVTKCAKSIHNSTKNV